MLYAPSRRKKPRGAECSQAKTLSFQARNYRRRDLRDAARTQRQDRIALRGQRRSTDSRLLERSRIFHAIASDRRHQRLRGHALDRLFARRIDIQHLHRIGLIEGRRKFDQQVSRPRVAVGLKDDMQLSVATLPRRVKGRDNLRGMMPIIVNYRDLAHATPQLKTPVDATKIPQPLRYLLRSKLQLS